jgi:heat shock protein HslJ
MHRFSTVIGRTAAALALTMLAACGGKGSGDGAPAAAPAGPPPTPTLAQLESATVSGVFATPVTLASGRYDGPPVEPGAASHPTLLLWSPAVAYGDVDGAAGNEAIALLSSNEGGSGEMVWVAVFGVRDGQLANLATAQVGDRVRLQTMWLEQGRIVMDVVEPGPSDPACCPTQVARRIYALSGGTLQQQKNEVLGVLGVSLLTTNEWQLVSIDGEPLPKDAKPPVIHFERDGVRGFAGCNRFTAKVTDEAPGRLRIGPAAATKMACPDGAMQLESRFLEALQKSTGYGFVAGQLALTRPGEPGGTLLFSK